MTEGEWLAATDPTPMLKFLRGKASDRKLRLFAVACCNCAWPLLDDPSSRSAIEIASRYADGNADQNELRAAFQTVDGFMPDTVLNIQRQIAHAICSEPPFVIGAAYDIDKLVARQYDAERRHHREKAGTIPTPRFTTLLRDVAGNPFRPVAVDPSWLTSTVTALVSLMYDSRDFSPMPILADALQDGGCEDEAILSHCRGDGPHVRGCFVVDLILGKV